MNTWIWGVVIIIILITGAWYFTAETAIAPADTGSQDGTQLTTLGTYAYECDEHVAFTMTPAGDMGSVAIAPTSGGTYPPVATLIKVATASGARYEGGGIVLTARGETVTLGEGESAINCTPVPDTDNAPFNFGD